MLLLLHSRKLQVRSRLTCNSFRGAVGIRAACPVRICAYSVASSWTILTLAVYTWLGSLPELVPSFFGPRFAVGTETEMAQTRFLPQ